MNTSAQWGKTLLGNSKQQTATKHTKDRIPNSYLTPTTVEETLREISKLDTNKAGGDDNLKPSLVKENKDILADKITFLINLSFKNGDVPYKLKLAKVIPIPGGGTPSVKVVGRLPGTRWL